MFEYLTTNHRSKLSVMLHYMTFDCVSVCVIFLYFGTVKLVCMQPKRISTFGFNLACVCVWFAEPGWAAALGALQRAVIKPQDLNRMLLRPHIVITSQQIPVWMLLQGKMCVCVCSLVVGGWRVVVFVYSWCLLRRFISCMLYHVNIMSRLLMFVCLFAAYLFHALLTKFL